MAGGKSLFGVTSPKASQLGRTPYLCGLNDMHFQKCILRKQTTHKHAM